MVVLLLVLLLRGDGRNTLVDSENDDESQGSESKMVVAIRMMHGFSRK